MKEELLQEKKQVEVSLRHHQTALQEAQALVAETTRQIHVHMGHLERINMWLTKMDNKVEEAPEKKKG